MRIKQTHKNPPDKQPLSGDSLRGQFHLLSTGCYPRQQNTADTTSPIAANHTQQMNSVEKNKTGLLIRLTLCSALFCLHIQLGISQAGTETAAQFVFFCFPQIGPLCSHKSTNSSYPNSLLVWPVSCVSVSWSKRQGERDGEENQTRYQWCVISFFKAQVVFLASSSRLSMHSLWRLCSEQHCDCSIPNCHTAGSAQSQRTGMFLYWKLFWKSQVKTSLS